MEEKGLVSKVELFVSCSDLLDKDKASHSDPIVVFYMSSPHSSSLYEVGRTEMLKDTLNPKFTKPFVIDFHFEQVQKMCFKVYDVDNETDSLLDDDFLGKMICNVGDIAGSRGQSLTRPLSIDKKVHGTITVRMEEIIQSKLKVKFNFWATELDNKDFFGKSDPFLVISRSNEDGSYVPVHKTEVVKNSLKPQWNAFKISAQRLCNSDKYRPLELSVYDWDSNSDGELIGSITTSLEELSSSRYIDKELIYIKKDKKTGKEKKRRVSGKLFCSAKVWEQPTFLDYIAGGCEVSLMVSIDFTASNEPVTDPRSLHFISQGRPNAYEQAIMSVGDIIAAYDSDALFPSFGYGARIPPSGQVSHCFPLRIDGEPECHGIEGLLQAYRIQLSSCQLFGPTLFAPSINRACEYARRGMGEGGQKYNILLIITDGCIMDMEQTIRTVVEASHLPLSIIIVGVGNEDFSSMEELDSDEGLLVDRTSKEQAERDIVQFVPFGRFSDATLLAEEVLAEVPRQLVEYMTNHNLKPLRAAPPPYSE